MIYHSAEIDVETGLFIRPQHIYIAGKPAVRTPEIRHMYKHFESIGHNVTYKWADVEVKVEKPYRENLQTNLAVAEKMLAGAAMADVFVFFQDEDLHGALEERGAFSVTNKGVEGKKLYIVEDRIKRESIFDSFDIVEIVPSTDRIYDDLGRIANLANITAIYN